MKPRSSARFLLRFSCLATALVSLGWGMAEPYSTTFGSPVNWLLESDGLPVLVRVHGADLTLLQRGAPGKAYRISLAGQDTLFVALLGALALCAAVPRVSPLARVLAVALLAGSIWAVQAVGLYAAVYAALGDLVGSLSPSDRQAALAGAWRALDPDRAHLCSRLAGVWLAAAPPSLGLLAWLYLTPFPRQPPAPIVGGTGDAKPRPRRGLGLDRSVSALRRHPTSATFPPPFRRPLVGDPE